MENYHEASTILTAEKIAELNAAFERSFSPVTAFPAEQAHWTTDNKPKGHCAVVTLVVQDLYGGAIVHDQEKGQYWNLLPDGSQHDFTRSQYDDDRIFEPTTTRTRERVLFSTKAREIQTLERYEIFRTKVMQAMASKG